MLYVICFFVAALYGIFLGYMRSNMSVPELHKIEHINVERLFWAKEEIDFEYKDKAEQVNKKILYIVQQYERHEMAYSQITELDSFIPQIFSVAMVFFSPAIPNYLTLPFWTEIVTPIITFLFSAGFYLFVFEKKNDTVNYDKKYQENKPPIPINAPEVNSEILNEYLDNLLGIDIPIIEYQTREYRELYHTITVYREIALVIFTVFATAAFIHIH